MKLKTNLKRDVISTQSDFQLLTAVFVFLRPLGVVFLDDLALLDDSLNLVDNRGAHTHYGLVVSASIYFIDDNTKWKPVRALFLVLGHHISLLSFRIKLSFL